MTESATAVAEQPSTEGKFWRQDDIILHPETGAVIKGGMLPKQREWWNLPNDIKIYVGGYGCGKTYVLAKWLIAMTLKNAYEDASVPGAYISPTHAMARETVFETIRSLLYGKCNALRSQRRSNGEKWPELDFEEHKSSLGFTMRLGTDRRPGRLLCFSGETPERMKGVNLAFVGIDEPFVQDIDVLNQSIARTRHPKAKQIQIAMTGTPEQLNWGYDLIEGELQHRYDVGWVRASTRDNITLKKNYVDKMVAAYDDRLRAAYVEGEFVTLSDGLVYYGFDLNKNLIDAKMPEGAELGVGMDFNVDPMAFCLFWKWRNERMHIMEEFELPNSDTEYACSMLKERFWDKGLRKIYPDASGAARSTNAPGGKSDFHYIKQAGFIINAKHENPLRKDRYNSVNSAFKHMRLTVSPKCQKLKRSLLTYCHELMKKESQKAMSHLLDAL
ncbi:MAG: terminase large subunit domain-containing protein, partial [Planctomycetota bacterium]